MTESLQKQAMEVNTGLAFALSCIRTDVVET